MEVSQINSESVYLQREYGVHFQSIRTVYAKIEILNKYDVVIDEITAQLIDGNINLESDSPIRRTCDLTLLLQQKLLFNENSPLWGNKRMRISIGIKDNLTDEIIYFKKGIFVINTQNVTVSKTGREVGITGNDKMCLMNGDISGELLNMVKIEAETPIHEAIRATVSTLGEEQNYLIDEVVDENGNILNVPYDIEKNYGDTVWSIIEELNKLYMNYQSYYDINGIFRFHRMPSRTSDAIRWDFTNKDFRITSKGNVNVNNIKNHFKVWGGVQVDTSQPSAEIILTNATHPTNPFTVEKWGERKHVITEDKYATVEMCSARAEYESLQHTVLQEQIEISCLPIYMLDINDVVKFNSPDDGIVGHYLITSMTIPLKPDAEMSFSAYKIYDYVS
jgi:hypothetical protein